MHGFMHGLMACLHSLPSRVAVRAAVQQLGRREAKRVCSGAGVSLLLLQHSGSPGVQCRAEKQHCGWHPVDEKMADDEEGRRLWGFGSGGL